MLVDSVNAWAAQGIKHNYVKDAHANTRKTKQKWMAAVLIRAARSILQSMFQAYPSINRVGSCQHTTASIEFGMDSSLGNGDTPLFHHLVNGRSVNVGHLVKLVDAHDASIGQHHGSGF